MERERLLPPERRLPALLAVEPDRCEAPRRLLALEALPRAVPWPWLRFACEAWVFFLREPRVALELEALRRDVRSEPLPASSLVDDERLDGRRVLELPDDLSPRGMNGLL